MKKIVAVFLLLLLTASPVFAVTQYGAVLPSASNPGNASAADTLNNAQIRMGTFAVTYTAAGSGTTNTLNCTASAGGIITAITSFSGSGVNYVVGDVLSVGSGTNAATIQVVTAPGGNITAANILQGGTGYTPGALTTLALTERAYLTITPQQTNGWSYNASSVINTGAGVVSPNTLANGGSAVTTGSGGTAMTYQMSDLATGKQASITTSETVTEILSVTHASDAATSVSKNYWYSGYVSSGSMILNVYTTANSVPAAWAGITTGVPVYFNVLYVVGGAP